MTDKPKWPNNNSDSPEDWDFDKLRNWCVLQVVEGFVLKGSAGVRVAMHDILTTAFGWNKAKLYAGMKKMEHERDDAFAEANSAREAMKREYHRRKEAEVKVVRLRKALIDIADDYEDRHDLTSQSTNPGIKTVIENARKVLSSDAPTPTVPTEHECDECEDGSWFDGSHGCSRTCKKCRGTGILKEKS